MLVNPKMDEPKKSSSKHNLVKLLNSYDKEKNSSKQQKRNDTFATGGGGGGTLMPASFPSDTWGQEEVAHFFPGFHEKNCQLKILYPAKRSSFNEGKFKIFSN